MMQIQDKKMDALDHGDYTDIHKVAHFYRQLLHKELNVKLSTPSWMGFYPIEIPDFILFLKKKLHDQKAIKMIQKTHLLAITLNAGSLEDIRIFFKTMAQFQRGTNKENGESINQDFYNHRYIILRSLHTRLTKTNCPHYSTAEIDARRKAVWEGVREYPLAKSLAHHLNNPVNIKMFQEYGDKGSVYELEKFLADFRLLCRIDPLKNKADIIDRCPAMRKKRIGFFKHQWLFQPGIEVECPIIAHALSHMQSTRE